MGVLAPGSGQARIGCIGLRLLLVSIVFLFFWDKSNPSREKEEEEIKREKNAFNNRHYILPAMPEGNTHTLLGPISLSIAGLHL
jgi:hypothetical protein